MMATPNNVTQQANEAVVDEVFKVAPSGWCEYPLYSGGTPSGYYLFSHISISIGSDFLYAI